VYQGIGTLDVRYWFPKDKLTGWTGAAASHMEHAWYRSAAVVPSTLETNNIAAAQGVTNGTAMTLAGASFGVATNIPYRPFTGIVPGGTPVVAPIALDFGFDYGTTTAGSTTVTVGNAAFYTVGMPLCIAQAGNGAGTAALLTNVVSANTTANTIVIANAAVSAQTGVPIGTGDVWGPNEVPQGYPPPLAAAPWIAGGPSWLTDSRQCLQRGVQIVGPSGGTGGGFLVTAATVYGETVTQLITVAAGSNTVYGTKAVKYILSVVPQFTDTTHNYTVGTSDMFGLLFRADYWEDLLVAWAGSTMTASTGFTAAVTTSPSTNALGDTRGTVQVSGNGPLVSGIGSSASNGTISGVTVSGRRLQMQQQLATWRAVAASYTNPVPFYGVTPA